MNSLLVLLVTIKSIVFSRLFHFVVREKHSGAKICEDEFSKGSYDNSTRGANPATGLSIDEVMCITWKSNLSNRITED